MHKTGSGKAPSALALVREGDAFRTAGDFPRAEEAYRGATRADPHCPEAWQELGCLMMDCRRFSEAITCFRQISGQADKAEEGDSAELAIKRLLEIAARRPDWSRGQFSLGSAYEYLKDFESARRHLANALLLDPSREAAVQALYARMYCLEEKWLEGIAAADSALAAKPTYFLAHVVRARCCSAIGDWNGSTESTRRAVESMPHIQFHSNLLFDMNYLPETTPESLHVEACRWNSWYAAPLANHIRPHTNTPDAERRLKVGYVSPDLRAHTITKFLLPVLERHDRSQVEVFVYSVGCHSDFVTDWIKGNVANFVPAEGPHMELAERVRQDAIDILIDLAGHTSGPTYLAFAVKPAPIQVSWMGVLSTTGLSTMDYFLGDAQMPCPGTEHLFTESIYRLPRTNCCYRPTDTIPVSPAPSLDRGYITFGCFNNPHKIHRDVIRLWSAILHLVPKSQMLFKWYGMEAVAVQKRMSSWFQEDGIASERLQFAGASSTTEYLQEYAGIDIALDPFPYNGGSTTLDTLWMGVPLVTLAGRLAVQRTGASVLTGVGLPDFIAQTPKQYLNIALYLAAIVPKVPELRQEIRRALLSSPFMDEIGIVRDVENAYRDMWRRWCSGRTQAI